MKKKYNMEQSMSKVHSGPIQRKLFGCFCKNPYSGIFYAVDSLRESILNRTFFF